MIFLKSGSVQYLVDGKPADEATIEGMPDRKEGEQAGLEQKVVLRTFALDSIVELRAMGQVWR